jgi:hypothetical protein
MLPLTAPCASGWSVPFPALSSFFGHRPATDPRDRGQDGDPRTKGLDIGVDLAIDLSNGRVDGIDLLEVQLQEAVVLGRPAAQRLAKLLRRRRRAVASPRHNPGCSRVPGPTN